MYTARPSLDLPSTSDSRRPSPHASMRADSLPVLLAMSMVLVAFIFSLRATHDLRWAPEPDLYRDIAAARAIVDGRFPEDPLYVGEVWWYNPLLPALVAALSKTTGLSLELLYAQAGPFLNILVPISFFAMSYAFAGAWAAVASLAAFLFFLDPALTSFQHATYSPWLYPYSFVQALAYTTLAALPRVTRRPTWPRLFGLGGLLGITFLGHAAPAVILAFAVVASLLAPASGERALTRRLVHLGCVGTTALLVVSPFLWPLYQRYGLRMVNHYPSSHIGLTVREALSDLFHLRTVIALLGVFTFFRSISRRHGPQRLAMGTALATTSSFLVYGLIGQLFSDSGSALPLFVPTFHFHLYFTALMCVMFGIGVRELGHWASNRVALNPQNAGVAYFVATCMATFAVLSIRNYPAWYDFTAMRASCLRIERNKASLELYEWFSRQPRGVVLSRGVTSLWIGAAGHPAVVTVGTYSNPYVSYESRLADAEAMYAKMDADDSPTLRELLRKYAVRYVVLEDDMPLPRSRFLQEAFVSLNEPRVADADPIVMHGGGPVPFLRAARVYRVLQPL